MLLTISPATIIHGMLDGASAAGGPTLGLLLILAAVLFVLWLGRQAARRNWWVVVPAVAFAGIAVMVALFIFLFLAVVPDREYDYAKQASDRAEMRVRDMSRSKRLASRKAEEPATDVSDSERSKSAPVVTASVPDAMTDGVFRKTITVGRFPSVDECSYELDIQILATAHDYVTSQLGPEAAKSFEVDLGYLRDKVVVDTQTDNQPRSVTPLADPVDMYQVTAKLEFTPRVKSDIREMYRQSVVQRRIWYTGGVSILLLSLIATVFSYLKVDLATLGAHTNRLKMIATAAILGVLVAGEALRRGVWSP